MRKKKTAKQVIERLEKLGDYINSFQNHIVTASNEDIMEDLGYTNRNAIQRDLNRLKDMNYIDVRTEIYTPVSITNGTAKQYIRKQRYISCKPSHEGLLPIKIGKKLEQLSHCGHDFYKRQDLSNTEWIMGWDHTLVRNPNYLVHNNI